jgi:hypothetical protein
MGGIFKDLNRLVISASVGAGRLTGEAARGDFAGDFGEGLSEGMGDLLLRVGVGDFLGGDRFLEAKGFGDDLFLRGKGLGDGLFLRGAGDFLLGGGGGGERLTGSAGGFGGSRLLRGTGDFLLGGEEGGVLPLLITLGDGRSCFPESTAIAGSCLLGCMGGFLLGGVGGGDLLFRADLFLRGTRPTGLFMALTHVV